MTAKRWILIAVAAGAALVAWILLFPSDETMLRRSVERLCHLASRAPSESAPVAFGRLREMATLMAPEAEAASRDVVVRGREEIVQHVAWAREQENEAAVSAEALVVEVAPDGGGGERTGTTTFVLRVRRADGSAGAFDGTRATLTWTKRDGDWLVLRADVILEND